MKRINLILSFCLFLSGMLFAQDVELSRYELEFVKDKNDVHFMTLAKQGVLLTYKTDSLDENKKRIWHSILLDSSLFEMKSFRFFLPETVNVFDLQSNSEYAVLLTAAANPKKNDAHSFCLAVFDRKIMAFNFIQIELPEKAEVHSLALVQQQAMIAINHPLGKGDMCFVKLETQSQRDVCLPIKESFVICQASAFENDGLFLVTARVYENELFVGTFFLMIDLNGNLQNQRNNANGDTLLDNLTARIGFKKEADRLVREDSSEMKNWFENRFLIYVYQVIDNDQWAQVNRKIILPQKVQFG